MSKFQAFKGNILTKQQKQQTKAGKGKIKNEHGCNNTKVKCEIQ